MYDMTTERIGNLRLFETAGEAVMPKPIKQHRIHFNTFFNRQKKRCPWTLFFLPILIILFMCQEGMADTPGISDNEILLGQSCALKGPTKALGVAMRNGALAYFKKVNNNGGIKGKKIRLISYDDGYEPDACAKNTKKLIDVDNVFLLFGYVGTPTSKVAVPIATEKKVPYFGPFTGAEFLRNPVNRYVFNIRASYYQETEIMVERLVTDKNIKRISVFYQNDSYGKAGLDGVQRAMTGRGLKILSDAHYPRNTLEVEPAVKKLLQTKPDAVLMIGTYQPCAKFINLMRQAKSHALFINISFVGANALGESLGNSGINVIITQVVPHPDYANIPIVTEYQNALKHEVTFEPQPDFVELEGFIAAKALCRILEETPTPITREGFIQTAEMQSVQFGGFSFSFSPDDHQGSDLVHLTQIGPGGFINPIEDLTHLH